MCPCDDVSLVSSCAPPPLQCLKQQWRVSKWDNSLPPDLHAAQASLRRKLVAERRAAAAAA